uniref:Uncharacterized protein TCIL3000_11_16300 n=1 Tax=Trypanosoma congolense (strain IL3000) TaxID=1068625 RepID=G0V397_TRYCI|nr:unnamed protein product [Trypanosoma congolense IL3000]
MVVSRKRCFIALATLVPLSGFAYWLLLRRKRSRYSNEGDTASRRGSCSTSTSARSERALEDEERSKYHAVLMQMKSRGNEFFQAGQFEAALEAYQNCVDACAALGPDDAVAVQVHQVVRVNVVLVFLKLQRPEEARMLATFLLQDETHPVQGEMKVKALYRRGLASQEVGDVESALCDFRAAVACSPGQRNPAAEGAILAITKRNG